MHISVVYALPNEQFLEELDVAEGTTAEEAVHMSGMRDKHPEIDLSVNKLGVFAKLVKGDQVLRDGDRVEIYRSLPRKPRDAHAVDDKKARIRARKEQRSKQNA
ncbi:MAG: RnfH family protein [Mariprofundus sp.]|nr:RnfH family protein [Mariprofundus sp.]